MSTEGQRGERQGDQVLGQGLVTSGKPCPVSSVGISLILWSVLKTLAWVFGEPERSWDAQPRTRWNRTASCVIAQSVTPGSQRRFLFSEKVYSRLTYDDAQGQGQRG